MLRKGKSFARSDWDEAKNTRCREQVQNSAPRSNK